jgi:hypothetical protein
METQVSAKISTQAFKGDPEVLRDERIGYGVVNS